MTNINEIINEVINLKNTLRSRDIDYNYKRSGGQIVYAIDSNIFKLFTDPAGIGSRESGNTGYAKIFKNSDTEVSKNLSMSLSHYLLHDLNKGIPLLVFDGHIGEVDSICNEIVNRAYNSKKYTSNKEDRSNKEIKKQLEKIYEKSEIKDNDSGENIKGEVADEFIAVSELIIKRCLAVKEIKRLSYLLDKSNPKIAGVSYLIDHHHDIFDQTYFIDEIDQISKGIIKSKIESEFLRVKPNKIRSKLEIDVDVIYKLFSINRNLIRKGKSHRLVLITGDTHLIEASNILSNELFKDIFFEFDTFSNMFIRKPISFLNDSNFIGALDVESEGDSFSISSKTRSSVSQKRIAAINKSEPGDVEEFDDILSLLKMFPDKVDVSTLNDDTIKYLESYPELVDKFLRDRLSKYSFDMRNYYDPAHDELIEKINKTKIGIEVLNTIYNKANSFFIKETNNLSFQLQDRSILKHDGGNICYRIPPLLRFNTFPEAENYVKSWIFEAGNVEKLYELVLESKCSDYFITLCSAAIWAHRDNWETVLKNAGRAVKLAMNKYRSDQENNISGHEAAYLYVVAQRHVASAKTREDLELLIKELEIMLHYAKTLWKIYWNSMEIDHLSREDPDDEYRFLHEKYSIQLLAIWYELFFFNTDNINDYPSKVNQLRRKLVNILGSIKKMIRDTQEDLSDNPEISRRDYLLYAQRHSLNNYFLIFIVLDNHELFQNDNGMEHDELREMLDIYDSKMPETGDYFVAKSHLHKTIMSITRYIYVPGNTKIKSKLRAEIYQLLSKKFIKSYSVKPYDQGRYEFFLSLIEST